jgi:hypothetical protein
MLSASNVVRTSIAVAAVILFPAAAHAEVCKVIGSSSNIDVGITSEANGPVDIFYVASNENLMRLQVNPSDLSFISGANLGGVARSEPAAVSWGPGHSAVFVRGSDGALWYLMWDNGATTGWTSLGGQITWNPHVVSMGPGHLIVFYRGTNQQLWYREYANGVWGPHTNLGGTLTSSPIGISWGPGHVAVFTRGQAQDLWYRQRTGSTWDSWVSLGQIFQVDPVVVSRGSGLMDVFVRGLSNVAWISYSGGAWGGWHLLGPPPSGAVSEPGAAATSSGELTVFVRGGSWGPDYRPIWRNRSFDGGITWSGWLPTDAPYASPSANNPEATANANGGWTMAAINFPSGARVGQLRACSTP